LQQRQSLISKCFDQAIVKNIPVKNLQEVYFKFIWHKCFYAEAGNNKNRWHWASCLPKFFCWKQRYFDSVGYS